jgi:hypothetical protein
MLANCCAAAARLQNALVTFSALHDFDATCCSMRDAVLSVISNSSCVNHPELFGQDVTSSCDSGGICCCGTRYSCGMDAARDSRFAAATFSHFCSVVMAGNVKIQGQQHCTMRKRYVDYSFKSHNASSLLLSGFPYQLIECSIPTPIPHPWFGSCAVAAVHDDSSFSLHQSAYQSPARYVTTRLYHEALSC